MVKNFFDNRLTDAQLDKISGGTTSEIIALADAMKIKTDYRVDEDGKLYPGLAKIVKAQLETVYGLYKADISTGSTKNVYYRKEIEYIPILGGRVTLKHRLEYSHKQMMDIIRGKSA